MKGKKTGGRTKGTPNKDTPQKKAIKAILRDHSLAYITPGDDGLSDLDKDLALMKASERAQIEVKLMEFHTPKMQSTSVDVNIPDAKVTIEDKLIKLSQEPEEE